MGAATAAIALFGALSSINAVTHFESKKWSDQIIQVLTLS